MEDDMDYSSATYQAISILIYIHYKIRAELYNYLSNRVISEQLNIPAPTVVKIMGKLKSAGIIDVREGMKGGNMLAKPLTDITLFDVFDAMERGNPMFKIHRGFHLDYDIFEGIVEKTINSLEEAEKAMITYLKKTRLSDLIPPEN